MQKAQVLNLVQMCTKLHEASLYGMEYILQTKSDGMLYTASYFALGEGAIKDQLQKQEAFRPI